MQMSNVTVVYKYAPEASTIWSFLYTVSQHINNVKSIIILQEFQFYHEKNSVITIHGKISKN